MGTLGRKCLSLNLVPVPTSSNIPRKSQRALGLPGDQGAGGLVLRQWRCGFSEMARNSSFHVSTGAAPGCAYIWAYLGGSVTGSLDEINI